MTNFSQPRKPPRAIVDIPKAFYPPPGHLPQKRMVPKGAVLVRG